VQVHSNKNNDTSRPSPSPNPSVFAAIQFKDNRPEATSQLKVQNMANQTIQLQSYVENTGQPYHYGGGKKQMAGKQMRAWLDPKKPIKGQSASLNKSQEEMMAAIRVHYRLTQKPGSVVKGHLLNDNLGGPALSNNLYPITKGANSAHLGYVENVVKQSVWNDDEGIFYQINVNGNPDITDPIASFDCLIHEWNPKKGKESIGKKVQYHRVVNSDLGNAVSKSAYHDVDDMEEDEATRERNPRKPDGFVDPATTVAELTPHEEMLRNQDTARGSSTYEFY
jgi:hypothetical protein